MSSTTIPPPFVQIQTDINACSQGFAHASRAVLEKLDRSLQSALKLEEYLEEFKLSEHVRHDVESVEETEFNMGVEIVRFRSHVSGVISKFKEFSIGMSATLARVEGKTAEALNLHRDTVAQLQHLEDKDKKGSIVASGILDRLRADDNDDEPQLHSACTCCSDTPSSTCKHKEMLAGRIMDRTFDEHKKLLRVKIKKLESELSRVKSGVWLEDAVHSRDEQILSLTHKLEEAHNTPRQVVEKIITKHVITPRGPSQDETLLSVRVAYEEMSDKLMKVFDMKLESVKNTMCIDALQQVGIWLENVLNKYCRTALDSTTPLEEPGAPIHVLMQRFE
eukprot:PhF_6_TR5508/c0_g1_i2/m.7798